MMIRMVIFMMISQMVDFMKTMRNHFWTVMHCKIMVIGVMVFMMITHMVDFVKTVGHFTPHVTISQRGQSQNDDCLQKIMLDIDFLPLAILR